jgi:methylenetetrahydrofolate reductase (NADPH)
MKISALLAQKRPTLSFEVFPPKDSDHFDSIKGATEEIAALHPDFMSVTCRGNDAHANHFTVEIAENLQNRYNVTSIAHLTCVDSTREGLLDKVAAIRAAGIENVLALRGDISPDNVMIIVTSVIAFYFGTQHEKTQITQ